jgi:hypothetical protein
VVDSTDQVVETGSVDKTVSQVDRRMDYDGDGVITFE